MKLTLKLKFCTFIEAQYTSDYNLTKALRQMLEDGANIEDIRAELESRNLPSDEGGLIIRL